MKATARRTLKVVTLPKSTRLTEPARKLLEKALTAMVRYPETVDMTTWHYHDEGVKPSRGRPEPYCGTIACLAGHVVIAGKLEGRVAVTYDNYDEVAAEALGLTDGTGVFAHHIFAPGNSATGKLYPTEPRAQARAVVARVKHWLRTGE